MSICKKCSNFYDCQLQCKNDRDKCALYTEKRDFLEDDVVKIYDPDRTAVSEWGNSTIELTIENIADLLNGKTLYVFQGEYGSFIKFKERKKK